MNGRNEKSDLSIFVGIESISVKLIIRSEFSPFVLRLKDEAVPATRCIEFLELGSVRFIVLCFSKIVFGELYFDEQPLAISTGQTDINVGVLRAVGNKLKSGALRDNRAHPNGLGQNSESFRTVEKRLEEIDRHCL